MKKTQREKKATTSALDATLKHLYQVKNKLEHIGVCVECLSFLERKAKLYPLKKKKIYQEVVDTATLVEKETMKKLIISEKMDGLYLCLSQKTRTLILLL